MKTEKEIVLYIAALSEDIALLEERKKNCSYQSCNPQTEAMRNAEIEERDNQIETKKSMREALLWLFEKEKELPF